MKNELQTILAQANASPELTERALLSFDVCQTTHIEALRTIPGDLVELSRTFAMLSEKVEFHAQIMTSLLISAKAGPEQWAAVRAGILDELNSQPTTH